MLAGWLEQRPDVLYRHGEEGKRLNGNKYCEESQQYLRSAFGRSGCPGGGVVTPGTWVRRRTKARIAMKQSNQHPTRPQSTLGRATFGPGPRRSASVKQFANRLAASGFLLGVIEDRVEPGDQCTFHHNGQPAVVSRIVSEEYFDAWWTITFPELPNPRRAGDCCFELVTD